MRVGYLSPVNTKPGDFRLENRMEIHVWGLWSYMVFELSGSLLWCDDLLILAADSLVGSAFGEALS